MVSGSHPNVNEKYSNGLDVPEVPRFLVLSEVHRNSAAEGFWGLCPKGKAAQTRTFRVSGPSTLCACTISFCNFQMVSFLSNNLKNEPYQNLSQNLITLPKQFCRCPSLLIELTSERSQNEDYFYSSAFFLRSRYRS